MKFKKNAGNVAAGVAFFNNATALAEDADKVQYSYSGPVFRFGNYWDDIPKKDKLHTEAKSLKQAINNLTYKAKLYFGLAIDSNLTLYEPYVKEEPFTTSEYNQIRKLPEIKKRPRCEYCGYELNDIGDCPVCDYGEYDLLQDDISN